MARRSLAAIFCDRSPAMVIVDEVALPVRFSLLARPGATLADIGSLASHPHALAQVRRWIDETLPGATVIPSLSTAGAAGRSAGNQVAASSALTTAFCTDCLISARMFAGLQIALMVRLARASSESAEMNEPTP